MDSKGALNFFPYVPWPWKPIKYKEEKNLIRKGVSVIIHCVGALWPLRKHWSLTQSVVTAATTAATAVTAAVSSTQAGILIAPAFADKLLH